MSQPLPEPSLGEQPHDPTHCHLDGRPHLGPCIDPLPNVQLWPYPWPLNEHCWIHDAHEPNDPNDLMVCGECGHIFRTEGDLQEAFADQGLDYPGLDLVFACPLCAHDF
jgi:rubredoxin